MKQLLTKIIILIALFLFSFSNNVYAQENNFDSLITQCLQLQEQDSLSACDEAIAIYPHDPLPWYGKSQIFSKLGKEEESKVAETRLQIILKYHQFVGVIFDERLQLKALLEDGNALSKLDEVIEKGEIEGQALGNEEIASLRQRREQIIQFRDNPSLIEQKVEATVTELRKSYLETVAN